MSKKQQEIKPVRIISDAPVNEKAQFGFDAYIKTISDLIAYKENETPLVIGVYGKWGSGKTTLMESIREKLEKDKRYKSGPASDYRICKTVWFQVWKYKNEDEILAALISEIFKEMERGDFFEKCKAKIEALIARINLIKPFSELIKTITAIDISEFLKDPAYKKNIGFYDVFNEFFQRLIWTYLSWRPQENKFEEFDETKGVLAIFIDDLDRCPEPKIVQVLETIKLFMDKKGCVFVIGAENEIIIKALEKTYKEDAIRFMDKIVQVTFNLPKIPISDFESFIGNCGNDFGKELKEHLPLIIPARENNPRNIKRFINDLSLQSGLVRNKNLSIEYKDLLLWNVIEKGYRDFYQELKDRGGFNSLEAMQEIIDKAKKDKIDLTEIHEKTETIQESLKGYFKVITLVRIVDQFRPTRQGLEQLITLTAIVEFPQKEPIRPKPTGDRKMVLIPKGDFIYQENETKTIEYDYEMDIYPVTNELFKRFILAGGYAEAKFWIPAGWEWKEKKNINRPAFWENETYNDPEQPVVGVSWYETDAYTRWLTESENDGHTYRLPTEEEWERAARGEDDRTWPWGNEFDKDKCNSAESKLGKPSRVTAYPNGTSPYGCYDMAGNVWEWTSSFYDTNRKSYELRGGSFYNHDDHCRCAYRNEYKPYEYNFNIGFRCTRIKP
jgi:Cdc6-like AAA superfamily ATPase